jgi:hypothetical protein
MTHSGARQKQVWFWTAERCALRNDARPEECPDCLSQIIQIEFGGAEEPRHQSRGMWLREGLQIAAKLQVRSRLPEVSHGSCLSTPTTISAWRSTRCLVDVQILYTPNLHELSGFEFRDAPPDRDLEQPPTYPGSSSW